MRHTEVIERGISWKGNCIIGGLTIASDVRTYGCGGIDITITFSGAHIIEDMMHWAAVGIWDNICCEVIVTTYIIVLTVCGI